MNKPLATHDLGANHAGAAAPLAHVIPAHVLVAVFAALIILTGITVAATWVDLGPWNLVAAMVIATIKAALVALYFMHLRYDHPFHALVFVAALVFLALFLVPTLQDTVDAEPSVEQFRQTTAPLLPKASP